MSESDFKPKVLLISSEELTPQLVQALRDFDGDIDMVVVKPTLRDYDPFHGQSGFGIEISAQDQPLQLGEMDDPECVIFDLFDGYFGLKPDGIDLVVEFDDLFHRALSDDFSRSEPLRNHDHLLLGHPTRPGKEARTAKRQRRS
jgi:hypothetical protein